MNTKDHNPMNPPPDERLVGVKEGAAMVGIAPFTLRKYAWQGRIVRYKVGRRVLFRVADLKDLLGRCRQDAKPEFELGR